MNTLIVNIKNHDPGFQKFPKFRLTDAGVLRKRLKTRKSAVRGTASIAVFGIGTLWSVNRIILRNKPTDGQNHGQAPCLIQHGCHITINQCLLAG